MIYQELGLCAKRNVMANLFLGRETVKASLGLLKILDWRGMKRQTEEILGVDRFGDVITASK